MNLYYQSGELYCRAQDGVKEYFYRDGTPKTVERVTGSILYWPNGKMKRKCSFEKGVRHGPDQMWSEEGKLLDEGHYERGKPVGKHCRYGKNGVIEEIEYLDGSRFNLRQWDDEGQLRTEAIWTDLMTYREKAWDRFEKVWIEKEGFWNGKKLVYV